MTDVAVAQRLRAALSMYEFGEQMYRAKARRENPTATDGEIEDMVRQWRIERPGAPHGDAAGRPSSRFR